MRVCVRCNKPRSDADMLKKKTAPDGIGRRCKRCQMDSVLRGRYGTTLAHKEALFAAQNGRCAICSKQFTVFEQACLDHDHATGVTRELLCNGCNITLGFMREDPARLPLIAAYLTKHKSTFSENIGQNEEKSAKNPT